ncbi:MAG: helix-turn-helix domain-containing protein [Alphaproteobacteria bacterium]|nr:helix-turn-helix domain-containing protein [Alphaproteobacteria bacterium]
MSISREQIRAALGLLNITQRQLSETVDVSRAILSNYLSGKQNSIHKTTSDKLMAYFDNRGVMFTANDGVARKPKNTITELKGRDGFRAFMEDVYRTTAEHGGEICVSNVDERNWIKWLTKDVYDAHAAKMSVLRTEYYFKIMIQEGDDFFIATDIAEYRHVPASYFTDQSFYVYGNKLALIEFDEDEVLINIIYNPRWAQSFRVLFNYAWENTAPIGGS